MPLPPAPPPGVALLGVAMSFADMDIYDEDYPLLWDNAVAFPGVRPSTTRVRTYHTDSDGNTFRTGGSS